MGERVKDAFFHLHVCGVCVYEHDFNWTIKEQFFFQSGATEMEPRRHTLYKMLIEI
jgi:hypothetical protein